MALQARVAWPPVKETEEMVGRGCTTRVNDWEALSGGKPSSVTCTVKWFVVPAASSPGVQVKIPLAGSMPALAGAPAARLKVRKFCGRSESAALTTTVTGAPAWTVRLGMA